MHKLNNALTHFCVIITLLVAATAACSATTWYVATTGSDTNNGTSQSTPFATVGHAIANSILAAGDTIDVDSGSYTIGTTMILSKASVTIQTTPGESQAVLNGTGIAASSTVNPYTIDGGDYDDVLDVAANSDVVNNFTFEGGGASDGNNFECVCLYGNSDTLENSLCEYGYYGGADISNWDSDTQVSGDAVQNCTFYDNSLVNINDNQADNSNWGGGVGENNCVNSMITGCTVYDNWGEGLTGSSNNTAGSGNTISNNTVYDNFSYELYMCNSEGYTVVNNLIYSSGTTAYDRDGYAAIGLGTDNEGSYTSSGTDPFPTKNCNIYNNIVIGGMDTFRYMDLSNGSGGYIFYPGGMQNYNIDNNIFEGNNGTRTNAPGADVSISEDSGHSFTWHNNLVWQTTTADVADDGGGGTQTYSNDCWDFSGGANQMSGSGDVTFANTNPGIAESGSIAGAAYWKPTSASSLNSSGLNEYSLFTYDHSGTARPSSGAWSIGAFVAYSSGGSDLVQETYNDPSVSESSISQAFSSSQTAGDLNVVVIGFNSTTSTVSSVSDTAGNTYTKAIGPTVSSLGTQYIYYAPNIKSGSNTVTVSLSVSSSYPDLRIAEYKNVGALDKTAGATGSSSSPNSGSVTTTSASEVLVGACTSGPAATTAGSGYTNLVVTSPDGNSIEDDTVTSTGSYSASVTLASSGAWVMDLATFMAAGSAPSAPTGLGATAGNGSVVLAWSTDSGATSYSVYRGTTSGGESGTAIGATSSTSYTDSTATNGITYYYKIKASNSYGSSGYSSEVSARPVAPIAFKQVNSSDPASGTTVTCAYSSSEVAGDMNIVAVGSNSTGVTINSVTDSAGNTYSKAVGITTSGGTMQAIYYAPNIKAGSNTVTVTFSGSATYPDVRILEYSGVYALDKTAVGTGTGSTAGTSSVTTSYARELLVAATDCYPTTTAFGSGWTDRFGATGDTDGNSAGDDTVSSTGSYSATATLNSSNYYVIQMVTLY